MKQIVTALCPSFWANKRCMNLTVCACTCAQLEKVFLWQMKIKLTNWRYGLFILVKSCNFETPSCACTSAQLEKGFLFYFTFNFLYIPALVFMCTAGERFLMANEDKTHQLLQSCIWQWASKVPTEQLNWIIMRDSTIFGAFLAS